MALVNVNINAATGEIEYLSSRYIYVSPGRDLKIDRSLGYAGIILDGKNIDFTKMVIKRIRGNTNPIIYLKPIIVLNGNSHRDPFVSALIDGVIFSFDQIPLVQEKVSMINELFEKLTIINSISYEALAISKLLYFMYTRELKILEPTPYALSNTHYSFPFLSCNFADFEEYQVLDILEIATLEGIFKQKFLDRIYLCSNCKSGHLSYRETCPKCSSAYTDTFDIVHHFPCAYVGPITDFTNDIDDQLNCPKCSKKLKHIGVDYDKPSVLHQCKNCDNRFQDFNVKAKCMTCTFDNPVEALVDKEIYEYQLTKKGENYALQGYVSTPKDIEDIIGTVKFDTFKTVVRYEIERLRQTEGSSNIVAITIMNAGQFYAKVGTNAQQNLLKDIVGEIRSSIRSSDMITFYSSSVILITMFEIPTRISQRIMDDIVKLLDNLTKNNFTDLVIEIKANVHQLTYNLSSELQINQLISM
ncbi:MAG: hypothetical protein ACK5B9_08955 [Flavobacteriia bacterium]|jgi:hypothetical protein